MLPFEKALIIVLDSARRLGSERVDITRAVNRILAEDVTSDIDMPPFDKATRDGYACRRETLPMSLHNRNDSGRASLKGQSSRTSAPRL